MAFNWLKRSNDEEEDYSSQSSSSEEENEDSFASPLKKRKENEKNKEEANLRQIIHAKGSVAMENTSGFPSTEKVKEALNINEILSSPSTIINSIHLSGNDQSNLTDQNGNVTDQNNKQPITISTISKTKEDLSVPPVLSRENPGFAKRRASYCTGCSFSSSDEFNGLSFYVPVHLTETMNKRMELISESKRRGFSLDETTKYASVQHIGMRKTMEDVCQIIGFNNKEEGNNQTEEKEQQGGKEDEQVEALTQIEEKSNYAFFAIYDGHGGNEAADYLAAKLHESIVKNPIFEKDTEGAISAGFKQIEEELFQLYHQKLLNEKVGTTACIAIIKDQHLYIANVGDSAAILCTKGQPIRLTTPHTPKNFEEKNRVEQCGGNIYKDIRLGHPGLNSAFCNLGVTRAFGDFLFKDLKYLNGKTSGLIADPEIIKLPLTSEDYFLFMASDGFWDVISTRTAINMILEQKETKSLDGICEELVTLAKERATKDNTTVLLVKLKDVEALEGVHK